MWCNVPYFDILRGADLCVWRRPGVTDILQTKRQGFCIVFLSILKIGPPGPTTGEWIANWSFYLTNWQLEVARHARLTGGFHLVFTPTTKRRR